MELKEFKYNEHKNSKIVIYGTTVGGKIIFQCLHRLGISVEFFCDRSKKYTKFCGVPVKEPSVLTQNKTYVVLIALTRSFSSAYQYMEQIGYQEVYCCKSLIQSKTIEEFEYAENEKELVADFLVKYSFYAGGCTKEGIVFPSLEVFITERCTLRCRDCSHLIPRYQFPKDYEIQEIISNLKNVLKVAQKICDLIILGGEPVLHKDLYKLLEWAYSEKSVENITIVSNGTVMPNEELLSTMKKTGARLRLSNYGKYSTKLNEIIEMCDQRGITCFVNDELWTDMGDIYHHSYTKEEQREMFIDCPFGFDMLLLKNNIFRCAHVAHLNNLGAIDSYEHDSVDISKITEKNIEDKKRELQEYFQIEYLEGCCYCNGIRNSIQGIEPAIQGIR